MFSSAEKLKYDVSRLGLLATLPALIGSMAIRCRRSA